MLRLVAAVLLAGGCGNAMTAPASDAGATLDVRAGDAADGGGSVDVGAEADGGTPTLHDFCERLLEVDVARSKKCLAIPDAVGEARHNVDTCSAWATAAEAGRLVYDSTRAAACLASYADRPCTGGDIESCVGVVQGTVVPGATCELSRSFYIFSECAGDAECLEGPTVTCGGTCVTRAKKGDSCNRNQPCALGTMCDARTSRCAPLAKAGEPCGITSIIICEAGLFCTDIIGGGTCMPQHPTGACRYAGECTPPAQCPSGGGVCQVPPEVGDACSSAAGCGEQLVCGPDQRCAAFGLPGKACSNPLQLCAVGACGPDNKCAVSGPGDLCNGADADCGPNAFCIFSAAESRYRCTARCF